MSLQTSLRELLLHGVADSYHAHFGPVWSLYRTDILDRLSPQDERLLNQYLDGIVDVLQRIAGYVPIQATKGWRVFKRSKLSVNAPKYIVESSATGHVVCVAKHLRAVDKFIAKNTEAASHA
jgi:hypothetical protein